MSSSSEPDAATYSCVTRIVCNFFGGGVTALPFMPLAEQGTDESRKEPDRVKLPLIMHILKGEGMLAPALNHAGKSGAVFAAAVARRACLNR